MIAVRQTWQVSLRYIRALLRQPAFVVITLIQPVIWLLLFGALFKSVTKIPGFHGGSYLDYLTPGVVVMLAVSSAGWTGMGFIEDINGGVMDRVLARQRETLIGAVSMVLLPLTFLSSALMQQSLVPGWIRTVAKFNPVNWAAEASRSAAVGKLDWGLVASRVGLLAALALLAATFATRAFGSYQRSL